MLWTIGKPNFVSFNYLLNRNILFISYFISISLQTFFGRLIATDAPPTFEHFFFLGALPFAIQFCERWRFDTQTGQASDLLPKTVSDVLHLLGESSRETKYCLRDKLCQRCFLLASATKIYFTAFRFV